MSKAFGWYDVILIPLLMLYDWLKSLFMGIVGIIGFFLWAMFSSLNLSRFFKKEDERG